MRLALALVAMLLLSGCIQAPEPKPDVDVKDRLVATMGSVYHSGAGQIELVPEGGLAMPDSCVLYRNEKAHARDQCDVVEGRPHFADELDVPWHIRAQFKGSDAGADATTERLHEKSVVAWLSTGAALAEWDGRDEAAYHEPFQFMIE